MTKGSTTFLTDSHTHVMFITGIPEKEQPIYYKDLASATEEGDVLLKSTPNVSCHIFQLKTTMVSKITVQRDDIK